MTDANKTLVDLIHALSEAPDGQLATPLSKRCADFLRETHSYEEQILFLRDLRDLAVHGGGASSLVMRVFAASLDHLPPETDEQSRERRDRLERLVQG